MTIASHRDRVMWIEREAIELCKELWPHMEERGFYIGITGSILYRGWSGHDLDLIVYPHDASSIDAVDTVETVRTALTDFGFELEFNHGYVRQRWAERGSTDTKYLEVYSWKGKRVDVFTMR